MTFLKATLESRVLRAMGWAASTWPTAFVKEDVYNEAGIWLYTSRQWDFLAKQFDDLDLVEGQDYLDLPAGFAGFLGVSSGRSNVVCSLRMSHWQAVMEQRTYPNQALGSFVGTMSTIPGNAADPAPVPVIAIGPTPSAGVIGAFQLAYSGTWPTITSTTTKLNIPAFMVPLYIKTVIEYLKGYERRLEGEHFDRMKALKMGDLYEAAVTHDDNLQPDCGGITGTAEQEVRFDSDPFVAPLGRLTTRVTGA